LYLDACPVIFAAVSSRFPSKLGLRKKLPLERKRMMSAFRKLGHKKMSSARSGYADHHNK